MKKLLLLAAAVISVIAYLNYSSASVPVALEKKIIENGNAESISDDIPAIKVMTYNIHRGINKNNELDLDGIVEVIKNSGAEIIALQEVERYSVRTGFKDQIGYIADKLSMHYAFGKSINILNGQYGNAILSIYPIEEYEVSKLPSEGERRTLLKAGLDIDGNKISVYNTHLGLNESERAMQIEEIIKITGDDKYFLLAGDFNMRSDKLAMIYKSLTDCASFEDGEEKVTFESEGLSERIDYIFVSKEFEIKEFDVIHTDASDHYPVISKIKLN
ncbi:MAG TPA: endonuclease/exonuclease/phosphatase family protein [Clostridia bacterium]|nr:endonuclease/exonuclease/phosphatase family protein [Clostridia bacterium]